MNTTPNINLSTYTSDPNDKFNLLVTFNDNMNKIDEAVGSQNDAINVIEASASTAVSTANTASATATEALTTAESKTSVNDNVASATTTYSSNKINTEITALTQEQWDRIANPDSTKYRSWGCVYVNRGKILEICGSFSFINPPTSNTGIDILTLPQNIEIDLKEEPFYVTGYISKNGDFSYHKNDVIFKFDRYNHMTIFFTDNFDYSQLTVNHVLHYSITLIKGN